MPPLRLIVITYHWPPFAGSGAGRWTALVKYLRRLGHEVTVVTTSAFGVLSSDAEEGVVRERDLASAQALGEPLSRLGSRRTGAQRSRRRHRHCSPASRCPIPTRRSWVPFAVGAARRILREPGPTA